MKAIKVENLSKSYLVGHNTAKSGASDTFRETLSRNARNLARKTRDMLTGRQIVQGDEVEEFWALKDVSFEIQPGDRVGIIGRNGAGKSTLLKILSRITEPTRGRVTINGRVASLLEVGTGFHPELTGRENIFLNGAILGMGRKEIQRKFDEIVEFAEVEKFLDTPVKRYSSGMYVRLAFAVAAHLEPEILVVDEVLAVGDAQFQKKCLGKMEDVAGEGRTVLFVSHNMSAVTSLCTHSILLNAGKMIQAGATQDVIAHYLNAGHNSLLEQVWNDPQEAPGNERVRLHSVRVININAPNESLISVKSPIDLEFIAWVMMPNIKISFNIAVLDSIGGCVFNIASKATETTVGKMKSICHIPAEIMNDGVYTLRLMVLDVTKDIQCLLRVQEAAVFEVIDHDREGDWHGKWPGAVRPTCFQWGTCLLDG